VVFFNYTTMQMTAKIVYYGPGLCGKTTNLQFIHHKTAPQSRGEMVSLETETDRTLFFDFLPVRVERVGDYALRLALYTVPGQVFYNATRKLVLKGVDGVVFVADSQKVALDANMESLANLKTNLSELGLTTEQVPIVFQYNKRDIRNILPVDALEKELNPEGARHFEAAALHGVGVFETLKAISRVAIGSVRKKLSGEEAARTATSSAGVLPTLESLGPAAAPGDASAASDIESLVSGPDAVEFAQEDTAKHVVPVKTKAEVDIQRELEKLRALTTGTPAKKAAPAAAAPKGGRDIERRLKDMLGGEQAARQQVKRKASVEVPGALLKGNHALRIQLSFTNDAGEEVVHEATTIGLRDNKRLEWLALQLEIDVKAKG
jgi:signal recognition particle receptor subunit beta